ncbi:MAG: glycolate oxidase subunit GlcF [Thiobacillaceae bacterium]
MQTTLSDAFKNTADGIEAERILRSCVHCGFCLATCPSYQILGNELDSPRGRIYLIKQLVEGAAVSAKTQLHLDRCLTCRNCETTCPSGVEYGKLLDIGRSLIDARVARSYADTLARKTLGAVIPNPALFTPMLKAGQALRPFLPGALKSKIPARLQPTHPTPSATQHARSMLLLEGCAQPALVPNINAAATRVLDRLGIRLFAASAAGCCGAVKFHLDDHDGGLTAMRKNIDAWLPHLDAGAEAIVMTASGCGVMVKDYGWHLRNDPDYAEKAARVAAATKDLSEIVLAERDALARLLSPAPSAANTGSPAGTAHRSPPIRKVAYHPPCTLQHGQKLTGGVETLLAQAGFELTDVAEKNLCCGSAGTYSILQPAIAGALKTRKLNHLQAGQPEVIVTANIGCLTHLQSGSSIPVQHWVELLDSVLPNQRTELSK